MAVVKANVAFQIYGVALGELVVIWILLINTFGWDS